MANLIGLFISCACVFAIGLSYVYYPIIRRLTLQKAEEKESQTIPDSMSVAIIFAAYNESEVIEEKITSIFNTAYKQDLVEVWVGSDKSTDGTDEIVKRLQKNYPNLNLFRTEGRAGKSAIMNVLASKTSADILIATDANIIFEPHTIPELIIPLSQSNVGAVAGTLQYKGSINNGTAKAEGSYLNIENTIRLSESQNFGFCLGMEGGLYAIRAELWEAIPKATFMEDFFQTMQLLSRGYNISFNPKAIGLEDVSTSLDEEFKRKIRISLGNFQNLKRFKGLLVKKPYPLGYAFLVHKVLRWVTPHLLVVLMVSLLLNPVTFYAGLALLAFFLLQFIAIKFKIHGPLAYFCAMNVAMLIGYFRYMKGVSSSVWEPTKRSQ